MSTDDSARAVPPPARPRSDPAGVDPTAVDATADAAAEVPAEVPAAGAAGADVAATDPPADPTGPPWSIDVVADLQAGRYPADVAGPLRQRLAADPWAASALAALDATVDELSLLPAPRMPQRFALRLDAALAAEARAAAGAGPGTVDRAVPPPRQAVDQSLSPARAPGSQFAAGRTAPPLPGGPAAPPPTIPPTLRAVSPAMPAPLPPAPTGPPATTAPQSFRGPTGSTALPPLVLPPVRSLDAARAKRRRWIGGLAAAAAVIVVGSATVASLQRSDTTPNLSAPVAASNGSGSGGSSALELDPGRLGDALAQIEGKRPAGPLQNTATYNSCLTANGINPSAVRGVTAVTFKGRSAAAIAVVLDPGHSQVVVVGPNCGIGGAADQLAAQTVDR